MLCYPGFPADFLFQFLIGTLQTISVYFSVLQDYHVSIPYRYATNGYYGPFYSESISVVSIPYRYATNCFLYTGGDDSGRVSIPYRYATNGIIVSVMPFARTVSIPYRYATNVLKMTKIPSGESVSIPYRYATNGYKVNEKTLFALSFNSL